MDFPKSVITANLEGTHDQLLLQSIGGGGRVFILRNLSNYLEDAHQMDEMDGCFLSTFPGENADVKCKKFNA